MKRWFRILKYDAIQCKKYLYKIITSDWTHVLFVYTFYLISIFATIHFFGWWYLIITIPYLAFGTFIAMFNDSGPEWLSYVIIPFWLPYALGYFLLFNPFVWILIKLNLVKPKYY